jgi:ADP-ribose pyrophosphatase YjhB (NUDIX family)
MITFDQGKARFNHRVAGIVLNGDRVLIHRAEIDDFWSLPGGRVSILESTADALEREMQEELDVEVDIKRLVWVVENFFDLDFVQ